jgi:hypothetical protein
MPTIPDYLTNSTRYAWNDAAGRYIDTKTGRFVSRQAVRGDLDAVLDGLTAKMDLISQSLVQGSIDLDDWQLQMMDLTKRTHLVAAAAQKGGWAQMTQADFGRVGQIVRREYEYLRRFANQIESGEQPLDGNVGRRARMYGQQGRNTYYAMQRAEMRLRGFDEERSILHEADHCQECVSEEKKGFQPIGDMIQIGQRLCRSNCKCSVEYRNSATGETTKV